MSKLILFSNPYPEIITQVLSECFNYKKKDKYNILYLPSNGQLKVEYFNSAKDWFLDYSNIEIICLQESDDFNDAKSKISNADIIIATGGNTCKFVNWLRKATLVEILKSKLLNEDIVWIGFSAGAMLLTPSIEIAAIEPYLENEELRLTDLSGMNILDFEIFPHFEPSEQTILDEYRKVTKNEVRTIGEKELMIMNI